MTLEIAEVLLIVLIAVVLFVSDKLRVDLIALMVLGALVITQLITPTEALSGFSNPAVVTVWAVFILSGALSKTGVANVIGNQVMHLAGNNEFRLLVLIMLTAAVLSAFMNNVGVAALLLPVVMEIARRTGMPPSKLLIPLAFGALLGGLTTLIGTPPNILVSDALRDAGFEPFGIFDFAPVGLIIMIAGIAFMVLIGKYLLPNRNPSQQMSAGDRGDLEDYYQIENQMVMLKIPSGSHLSGMTLADSKLGSTLGLNVVAIVHNGQNQLAPPPGALLQEGDRLLAVGRAGQLEDLRKHQVETIERFPLTLDRVEAIGLQLAEANIIPDSDLIGKTLADISFRKTHGVNVLSIRRGDDLIREGLYDVKLEQDDILLLQGESSRLQNVYSEDGLIVTELESAEDFQLQERLLLVYVPSHSALAGKTLVESKLGELFGLTILRIIRSEQVIEMPEPNEEVMAGDTMLVQSSEENIASIRGLEQLELDDNILPPSSLESEKIGLVEAVLSPHTTLTGKTLRDLHFRSKYGLNVLAIWRSGKAFQEDLVNIPLKFGDALLLFGSRENLRVLGTEPDFLVLTEDAQEPVRKKKAPIAVAIMVGVFVTVLLGWLPIAVAAVIGGTLMVLSGALTMEEAYRYIEWPAVFLIAAMLPLGIAMQNSGAADYVANGMLGITGDFGSLAILAGLMILSILASQFMPNAAVVVLMAPIALATARDMDISPLILMMGIAIAASASFLSPVSHPANVLIMGPGGYRFSDYIKVGLPLTIVVVVIALIVLPIFWPF
jgi:di/tricarboxylate transporter